MSRKGSEDGRQALKSHREAQRLKETFVKLRPHSCNLRLSPKRLFFGKCLFIFEIERETESEEHELGRDRERETEDPRRALC